jgi:hypothetical protein
LAAFAAYRPALAKPDVVRLPRRPPSLPFAPLAQKHDAQRRPFRPPLRVICAGSPSASPVCECFNPLFAWQATIGVKTLRVAGPSRYPLPPLWRPSRPVRFAAGIVQLSRAKVGRGLPASFASLRCAARLLPLSGLLFRSALVPRHAGPESAKGEDGFLRCRLRLSFLTQPRPVPWRVSVALDSEWLRYSVPHSLS